MVEAEEPRWVGEFVRIVSISGASKRKYRNRNLYDIHVSGTNTYLAGNLDNGFVVHNTMAGGHAMFHEFSLVLRISQISLNDADKTKFRVKKADKSAATRHSFSIKKEKVLTMASAGEFVRIRDDLQELDLTKGMVDDFSTVMNYAKEYGLMEKDGQKWKCMGKTASKQTDFQTYWKRFPKEYLHLQKEILKRAKERLSPKTQKPESQTEKGSSPSRIGSAQAEES